MDVLNNMKEIEVIWETHLIRQSMRGLLFFVTCLEVVEMIK